MTQARHSTRVIGAHNSAMLDALSDTYAAGLRLAALGMEITMIQITSRRPLIVIADPGPRLRVLRGEVKVRRSTGITYRADQAGVEVEWEAPS